MSTVLEAPSRLNIVSSSALLPMLANDRACLLNPSDLDEGAYQLQASDLEEIVGSWRVAIDRKAKLLAKMAHSNFEGHKTGSVYAQLNNSVWRHAALITEVFRQPDLTKNAGWLDPSLMQSKLAMVLTSQRTLSLEIAWGQAKRSAGRLKIFGAMADLSEAVALANLAVLRISISKYILDGGGVQIRVLGGSARFERALFTNPDDADAYDLQRQIIANFFCDSEEISVKKFGENLTPAQRTQQELRVDQCLRDLTNDVIAGQVNTIALNVDWTRFFRPTTTDTVDRPFGVALPEEILRWMESRDDCAVEKLTRAALTSFINPRCFRLWHATWADVRDVLDQAVRFVSQVSWEATRHYIALHAAGTQRHEGNMEPLFRLTVHEKLHELSLPAIYTLGPQAGNQLSQHVVTHLRRDGKLWFGSVVELGMRENVRPIS